MTTGTVKWFSSERGYGFVHCPKDKADYYFGVRNVVGATLPQGGEEVTFTPQSTDRGLSASKVEIVSPSTPSKPNDKVQCRSCGTHMTPRLVSHNGAVSSTICPFCLSVHYKKPLSFTEKLAFLAVGLAGFSLAVVMMLSFLSNTQIFGH